jgi:hypothetical protein
MPPAPNWLQYTIGATDCKTPGFDWRRRGGVFLACRLRKAAHLRALFVQLDDPQQARIGDVKGAALDAGSSTKPGLKCPVFADERAAV